MTNRKAATLSGTLLARKGAARPAGFREPGRREFVSEDLDSNVPEDGILESAEVVGVTDAPADGATLAPELLNIRSLQPRLDGGSTALSAGPQPLWDGDAGVTELSRERQKPWRRNRRRLILVGGAILAAILAGLYARASNPPEAAQDAAEVSSPSTAEQPIQQAGRGTARAALPRLAVSAPPPQNAGLASLADRTSPRRQEFAAFPATSERGAGGLAPIRAGVGLAAAIPRAPAVPNDAFTTAPAEALALVGTPNDVPPIETRVAAPKTEVAAWRPQQKPNSPLSALLSDAGDGVFVQLGSLKTAVGAMREWDKLVGEFPGILSGRPLKIERVALANRGAFYRIRTGPISGIARARAICAEFAARNRGCLVVRR